LFRVVGHGAKTIAHDVEEIADRGLAQTLGVVRRRVFEAALHNHAVAVTQFRVAGRTVDVEALLSARHHLGGNRERHVIAIVAADFAGVEIGVGLQMPTRHRALDNGSCRTFIGVEIVLAQRAIVGLVLHVFAAA